jgi:hypothetical protein
VMRNRQGVLESIATAVAEAPSLSLPRKRRRGRPFGDVEAGP